MIGQITSSSFHHCALYILYFFPYYCILYDSTRKLIKSIILIILLVLALIKCTFLSLVDHRQKINGSVCLMTFQVVNFDNILLFYSESVMPVGLIRGSHLHA